jgi:hypothetical protein
MLSLDLTKIILLGHFHFVMWSTKVGSFSERMKGLYEGVKGVSGKRRMDMVLSRFFFFFFVIVRNLGFG